ncbi:uncharacterized protein L969DRAFT_44221 [Mixia osmundae IAM 14324]|uniref:Zn(2)-C6 fungal-type domain-containing protein n=1 Tax=Mixia osmundae (strain CBS 9802 / IAM 14324 / JCM 22182 / KY 12970) TaxID=764103 RepID=G7E0C4_MIXOS|nr:uncharacterized protein L969DRAFT_44221 [Mixia osmundae IAM 14324]KEI42276.1 hypothetical protein L969DRAFT_44221 [Mixia osmundae IAM 14324]GAA96284.1 hypothetical protein E5Q_02950 [Mixia osmundae IAM 14324]
MDSEDQTDPAVERTFVCPHCAPGQEQSYTRKEHLDRHITSRHTDERPHQCGSCNQSFARKDILKRHEQSHMTAQYNMQDQLDPQLDRLQADVPVTPGSSSAAYDTSSSTSAIAAAAVASRQFTGRDPADVLRTSLSCDACSAGRTRCSGTSPCERCSRLGRACTYDRPYARAVYARNDPAQPYVARYSVVRKPGTRDLLADLPPPPAAPQHKSAVVVRQDFMNALLKLEAAETALNGIPQDTAQSPSQRIDLRHQSAHLLNEREDGYEHLKNALQEVWSTSPYAEADPAYRLTPELFKAFIDSYFKCYGNWCAVVHKPSFKVEDTSALVLLTMASIGARYAGDVVAENQRHADALTVMAYRAHAYYGDRVDTVLRPMDHNIASVLMALHHVSCGQREMVDRMLQMEPLSSHIALREGLLVTPDVDWRTERVLSAQQRWELWKLREERQRIGWAAMAFSQICTMCWGTSGDDVSQMVEEVRLPCPQRLWQAQTAEEWVSLLPDNGVPASSPVVSDVLRRLDEISRSSEPEQSLLGIDKHDFTVVRLVLVLIHSKQWQLFEWQNIEAPALGRLQPSDASWISRLGSHSDRLRVQFARLFLPPAAELTANIESGRPEADGQLGLTCLWHFLRFNDCMSIHALQDLAQGEAAHSMSDVKTGLVTWASQDSGRIARETLFHASQLLHSFATDMLTGTNPMDPFMVFYSTLAVFVYIQIVHQPAPANAVPGALVDMSQLLDAEQISQWIDGRMPHATVVLTGVEDMLKRNAATQALMQGYEILSKFKVWPVSQQFAAVLQSMAQENEAQA